MSWEIRQGDALEKLREMPDGSVHLILTDPPYYRFKSLDWDRQWKTAEAYLEWIGHLCQEWRRVLTDNGSLYVFASDTMAARVEVEMGKWFHVLNRIVWMKHDGTKNKGGLWDRNHTEDLTTYFPQCEYILFAENRTDPTSAAAKQSYTAKCDDLRGDVFEPLRAYLVDEWITKGGFTPDQANEACGTASMAGRHFFARSQWCLPTRIHYEALQRYAADREHSILRREYEELRRPFSLTAVGPVTDCWTCFPTVPHRPGKHPCEKPVPLLRHIIRTSSRPGQTVLDSFAGSGSTGDAARTEGRAFIGLEADELWVTRVRHRLEHMAPQGDLFAV